MPRYLIVFCLVVLFSLGAMSAEAAEQIRVGVVNGQRSVVVQSDKDYELLDVNSGQVIQTLVANTRYLFVAEGNSLKLDSKTLPSKRVLVVGKEENSSVNINRNVYRGKVQINLQANGSSLNAINVLPVEEYLYGTLANYLEPLWPDNAAKAQAIVFRTIAQYMINNPVSTEYDVPAVYWLFYDGKKNERDDVIAVVNATKGQVIVSGGRAIRALFHSSSGGRTEEVTGVNYLQSTEDYDQDSPNYKWEKLFVAKDVDVALKYAGYDSIGRLQGFEFSPLDLNRNFPDRGKSGRLKEVKVLGDRGFAVIPGEKFIKILNLPSSAFDLAVANLLPQFIELPITDRFGNVIGVKKVEVNLSGTGDNVPFPADRSFTLRVAWAENEKIVIKGRGEGSGIGFSQWGARGMALDKGANVEAILQHYYPNTAISTIY